MISPHTLPGTKVVCVDDSANGQYLRPAIAHCGWMKQYLTKGSIYTVADIQPYNETVSGFEVRLCEVQKIDGGGFDLHRFRYLDLPSCLTDCLDRVDEPLQLEAL